MCDSLRGHRHSKAEQIARDAQKRYEALCTENASDSKELRAHSYKRIYPGIAVYEALRAEGISQEKAVWYIREYFQRFAAKRVPLFQWAIKTFGLARKFPSLFKSGIEKAAHQAQDLPLNIQIVMVTKLASIL